MLEEKGEKLTALEFETNGVSTTPTPSVLGHSALHLLLATRIEPATEEEVEAMGKGDWKKMITRVEEGNMMTRIGGRGCRMCFQMPYGVEYIVRYSEVCGRILADTGSTTSLIKTDFAKKKRPRGISHGSRNSTKKCKQWVEQSYRLLYLTSDAYNHIG